MGLTNSSIGVRVLEADWKINKKTPNDKIIALAGNPNVGKSTVFNAFTGMKQHTGNWPGKTVTNAQGYFTTDKNSYVIVDLPGTYSLMSHSVEEEVARDFICFGNSDSVIVVCDSTSLERNLNLVLQTMEICENVIVCVNLMDEAERKNIYIDLDKLSEILGVPVVGCSAKNKKTLDSLKNTIDLSFDTKKTGEKFTVSYCDEIEVAIQRIQPFVERIVDKKINSRWLSLKLLDYDEKLINAVSEYLGIDLLGEDEILFAINESYSYLYENGIYKENIKTHIISSMVMSAEKIATDTVTFDKEKYNNTDRKIDKILTGKVFGYPAMILLLMFIFWITIFGANYISDMLSAFLFYIEDVLIKFSELTNLPEIISNPLILGIYRTLAWVVSVMLPPMAIFFPLFTLLEDLGYLPRVAYNLDKSFRKCSACGKQSLSMCMGFGCNAAGVVGCRIIDSKRERLLAIITNSFVPCNGKFPALIMIITLFFTCNTDGLINSLICASSLTLVIVFGILVTFIVTKFLSKTLLKGIPSSFTLELPPYRKPQVTKIIVRSIFDRTLFVLGRSVSVAAPAGLVIWLISNLSVSDTTILNHLAEFLDPLGRIMGLDGVILIGFILGFPASEIIIPIIIMAYMSSGIIPDVSNVEQIGSILVSNGWNIKTAVSFILFMMLHWPCSTTLITIKKETGKLKWALLSAIIPTLLGLITCTIFNLIF